MNNTKNEKQPYDEEAALVAQMKDDCDRMIQDAFVRIDAMIAKIEDILSKDSEMDC